MARKYTPHQCPKCGAVAGLRVEYGMPESEEAYREAKERGIYLAGCIVEDFDRHCMACQHDWVSDAKRTERRM